MTNAELRMMPAFSLDLGLEPAIEAAARRYGPQDRRALSLRWLAAIVLTGIAGSALIGITIYAAVNGHSSLAEAPERAVAQRGSGAETEGLRRGDRLVKAADVVAEKQKFRAPTTLKVGDRQVIRVRGFTRVSTTLTLAPTGGADDVPEFNPLKLLGGDAGAPDLPPDPGPVLNDADASFTVSELAAIDAGFGAALSEDEVQAQVGEFGRASTAVDRVPLPAQALLMRTTRAGVLPPAGLGFADPGFPAAPFSSIEVRMVPENVTQAARTDPARDRDAREKLVVLRHGDALDDILRANGASRDQARSIIDAFAPKRGEAPVADGRRLKLFFAKVDDARPPQVARLSVYSDENLETTIALDDAGDYVRVDRADDGTPQVPRPRSGDEDVGGMRLYDSFYQTALKQDLPRPVIDNLVRIFANDVDFQRSVAGGDSFDAFYGDGQDGEAHPELLYAAITIRDEIFKYYRFQTPDDAGVDFYDENGRSVRKFLIRNPVPTGLFTSGFGIRFHPILGYSRPHTGVDWAAPIGTPILAAGSGTVLRAARESAYGNRVEIQHANGYITTYSHMAGFARGIVDGARVRQGQVVGYLGQTGLATGPHLHYEVIVNGHFVDPMRVKLARTREIAGKTMEEFKRERDRIEGLMASAPNAVASGADKHASN